MDDVEWLPELFEFEYIGPAFYDELEKTFGLDRHEPGVHAALSISQEKEKLRVITERNSDGTNAAGGYIDQGAVEVCNARHPTEGWLCRLTDVPETHHGFEGHVHAAQKELKGPRSGGWVWHSWPATSEDFERWQIEPS